MTAELRPPDSVLAAFGVRDPVRIGGEQSPCWAADGIVLKPTSDPTEAAWCAEVLASLPEDGFRVARPVRSREGPWVCDGWTAVRLVEGEHDRAGRWDEVLAVCDAFHRALVGVPRPAFLDRRDDPWSWGDRTAWGEADPPVPAPLDALVARLHRMLRALDAPAQVIHGDLGGNVLFAEGLPPAVIDFVPYHRPAGFAAAIVVVDALTWEGADPSILDHVAHITDLEQYLARAVIYRMVTTAVGWPHPDRLGAEATANAPVVDLIVGLTG